MGARHAWTKGGHEKAGRINAMKYTLFCWNTEGSAFPSKNRPNPGQGFEGATTTPLKIVNLDALGIYIQEKHSYAVYDIQNFWERLVPEDHNQHDAMSCYLRSNTFKVKSRKLR